MHDLTIKSGVHKNKVIAISNYVSDSLFETVPTYNHTGYFLYAGRLSQEKGLSYLIEAVKKNPEIKLRIAGTGPEENKLRELAKNLNNVEFIGYRSGEEIKKEFENCIATVLPCNWFENCPNSLLESLVYGKPIIASRIGGIPEIVEERENRNFSRIPGM